MTVYSFLFVHGSLVELIVMAQETDVIHWERILKLKVFSSGSDSIVRSWKIRDLFTRPS